MRSFSSVPTGMNGIEMARDQNAWLALFRMRKARADAAAKALPPAMRSIERAHDRHVARGDVEHAFTAVASHVGLSHSTQPRSPCSMASESKGKVGGVHDTLSVASD